MAEDIKDHIRSRFEELKGQRQNYNTTWDIITEFVLPHRGDFSSTRMPGQRKDFRLFDSTAIQANEFLSATLHGGLTDPSSNWFALQSSNEEINSNDIVRRFLNTVTGTMFDVLNNPSTNFHSQNHELFLDLLAYGTACMYLDDMNGKGIRFKTIHLSEIYISEDMGGHIDTVFREFKFSARQAAQMWGVENLSKVIQGALDKTPDRMFTFLHCVKPNEEYEPTSRKASKLPFSSYYIDLEGEHLVEKKGYHEMPYLIPRWAKLVGEVYGRSPAWNALSDIRMINTMSETIIRAAQKVADPPILMADDGVMLPLQTRPGGVNFGGIDPVSGRPRMMPFQSGAKLDIGLEMLEQRRQAIRNAFYVDPLMFREGPQMTATEVLQRQEEKLRMIGPQVGRIQNEYLSPLVMRLYGLLQRSKLIPELPDELAEMLEQGGFKIEYTAPLARTQKGQQSIAIQRTIEDMLPLIQMEPNLMDNLNSDAAFRLTANIRGIPNIVMRPEEEVAYMRKLKIQQQQLQQELLMAQQQMAQGGVPVPTEPQQ